MFDGTLGALGKCMLGRLRTGLDPYAAQSAPAGQPVLALPARPQSLGEEIANSVSHGIGLLAALAAGPILISSAHQRGDGAGIVGACIFTTAMVLMYLTSTIFHALPPGRAKSLFE